MIRKVTVKYDDVTYIATGKDAERWIVHVNNIETLAMAHGIKDVVKWTRIIRHPIESTQEVSDG